MKIVKLAEAEARQAAKAGPITFSASELLAAAFPPREMLVSPILPTQGLGMIFAARGAGKTWASLSLAAAVATGTRWLNWSCPAARRVLFC